MSRFRRHVLPSDLNGPRVFDYVSIFNRRLTKRLARCQISVVEQDCGEEGETKFENLAASDFRAWFDEFVTFEFTGSKVNL